MGIHRPFHQPLRRPNSSQSDAASSKETCLLTGLISATEKRAQQEVRKQLENDIAEWLEPAGVPRSWTPPEQLINAMILEATVEEVNDLSRTMALFTWPSFAWMCLPNDGCFRRELQASTCSPRMVLLGGALGFVLISLAAISGYIRADEATKGYYTNRLRLLAAGGVGAAGVLIYQMLT